MKYQDMGIIIIYNMYPLIYLKYLLQKIWKDNLRTLDNEGIVEEEWEIIQIKYNTIINNYTHLIINVTHPLVTWSS